MGMTCTLGFASPLLGKSVESAGDGMNAHSKNRNGNMPSTRSGKRSKEARIDEGILSGQNHSGNPICQLG